eukprot:GHVH01010215.1.p1 GENE.GHVH01010215.1~~GHVH01010215.1.p1  ORF type:complete len:470 (+),score=53.87 GHVH01010215.1:107-1516(+)
MLKEKKRNDEVDSKYHLKYYTLCFNGMKLPTLLQIIQLTNATQRSQGYVLQGDFEGPVALLPASSQYDIKRINEPATPLGGERNMQRDTPVKSIASIPQSREEIPVNRVRELNGTRVEAVEHTHRDIEYIHPHHEESVVILNEKESEFGSTTPAKVRYHQNPTTEQDDRVALQTVKVMQGRLPDISPTAGGLGFTPFHHDWDGHLSIAGPDAINLQNEVLQSVGGWPCPMDWMLIGTALDSNHTCVRNQSAATPYNGSCGSFKQFIIPNSDAVISIQKIESMCDVVWPPQEVKSEDFDEPCPQMWMIDTHCNCCVPSRQIVGTSPCSNKLLLANAAMEKKMQFRKLCDVEWPCGKFCCARDYEAPCPTGYTYEDDTDVCSGPMSFIIDIDILLKSGACGLIRHPNTLNFNDRQQYEHHCHVQWPCKPDVAELGTALTASDKQDKTTGIADDDSLKAELYSKTISGPIVD